LDICFDNNDDDDDDDDDCIHVLSLFFCVPRPLSSIRSDIQSLTLHGLISSGGWDILVGDRRSVCQLILASVIALVEEGINGRVVTSRQSVKATQLYRMVVDEIENEKR
jgi:hypothetical protein